MKQKVIFTKEAFTSARRKDVEEFLISFMRATLDFEILKCRLTYAWLW